MNIESLKFAMRNLQKLAEKNSPTILTAVGVTGVVVTAIFTGRASIKAFRILAEEEAIRRSKWVKDTGEDESSYPLEFTPKEMVAYTWRCYIPAIAAGLLTVTAIVGSNRISLRRQAALASVYTLADKALKTYEEKVAEELGEKKAGEIKDKIAKDIMTQNPPVRDKIIATGKGSTLIYDGMSGRYFYSDLEAVRKIVNDFNKDILNHGFKTLNEFYDELDLPHILLGDLLGWGTDFGFMEVEYRAHLSEDDQPCIMLDYKVEPEPR